MPVHKAAVAVAGQSYYDALWAEGGLRAKRSSYLGNTRPNTSLNNVLRRLLFETKSVQCRQALPPHTAQGGSPLSLVAARPTEKQQLLLPNLKKSALRSDAGPGVWLTTRICRRASLSCSSMIVESRSLQLIFGVIIYGILEPAPRTYKGVGEVE